MSEEKVGFRVHRAHKMMDWIENEVTEWAQGIVFEHYGVEEVTELSRDQVEEVAAEADRLDEDYGDFISLGLYLETISVQRRRAALSLAISI